MAKIDHDAKTVSTVCQPDDEAGVRVALQEILDGLPGYKPVLVVEGADGKDKTYTSLTSSRAKATTTVVEEEPAEEEPAEETEESTEEEAEEDTSDEESAESADEEATEEEE
jgi:hypothetical protein